MPVPDWRSPEDYAYCENLTLHNWAWEFLRRNSAYRAGWAEIHSDNPSENELIERRKELGAIAGLGLAADPDLTVFEADVFWMEGAGVKMIWKWSAMEKEGEPLPPWPGHPHSCAILFNLRTSVDAQVEHVRRLLDRFQKETEHLAKEAPPTPRIRPQTSKYPLYVRALDGRDAGASQREIGIELRPESPEPRDWARAALQAAARLVNGDYLKLLHRPDL